MTYDEIARYIAVGDAAQRDTWPRHRAIARDDDGNVFIYPDETGWGGVPYAPTAEDATATDWLIYAG